LASVVRDVMKRRKLTQSRAATLFGVTQPRISDLTRNKLERFSIDMLIDMLTRAGVKVGLTCEFGRAA
jgi:predicted XRE-type DNA-binding protein